MVMDPDPEPLPPTFTPEPVLGGRGQLRRRQPVALVQVDHGAGDRGMGGHQIGDLGGVDVDVDIAVHGDLAQFGDQPGVVLGREEGGVHPPNTSVMRSSTATVRGRTSCSIWLR